MKTGAGLKELLYRGDRVRALDLSKVDPAVAVEVSGTVRALQAELTDRSSDDKRLLLEAAALVSPYFLDLYKDRRASACASIEYARMLLETSEECCP